MQTLAGLDAPAVVVVGLGPGDLSLLTLGALDALTAADRLWFRTLVHPTIAGLRERLRPEQVVRSFDEAYERAPSFAQLYEGIVDRLIEEALAAPRPIVYAVPGHPLVGERSVTLLRDAAPRRGVAVQIRDGVSFLEPLATAMALDPLDAGVQLLDGTALLEATEATSIARWSGLSPRVAAPGRPLVIGQVYDRRVASACKLWLLERYPPVHAVSVVSGLGTEQVSHRRVPLAELDHGAGFDHLTCLVIPPLDPLADSRGSATLPYIVARLRAPDGCPWDRKQTLQSLKPHLLEEAYEAVAALDASDLDQAVEELGDLLGMIVMLAQVAEDDGQFDLPQVQGAVVAKLVRRHPHVFGETALGTAEAVIRNWEQIKAGEREDGASALAGVPPAMPALIAAQVMGRKAAALGFDWSDAAGVYDKIDEELAELRGAAGDKEALLEEVGDLLFTAVSLCRHLRVDAEEALRRANAKFRARFECMERLGRERGIQLGALTADELEALWAQAKQVYAARRPPRP